MMTLMGMGGVERLGLQRKREIKKGWPRKSNVGKGRVIQLNLGGLHLTDKKWIRNL